MDEPLSNLDAKLRVQTRAEIARLHQRLKTTMVYVTHDQIEAMTMGTRIAVMNEGILQQVGTPQVLYDKPINRFVAGFIGSPSMNFVEVTLEGPARAPVSPARAAGRSRCRTAIARPPGRSPDAPSSPGSGRSTSTSVRAVRALGTFQARADVVEYLGNEELLHVSAADRDIVAIVDSSHRVRPGDILTFQLPLDKLHLFNGETGHSVAPDLAPLAAATPAVSVEATAEAEAVG